MDYRWILERDWSMESISETKGAVNSIIRKENLKREYQRDK